jgi:hypothetical protein
MTWYSQKEGDSLVIREAPDEENLEIGYICEIDIRYASPIDLKLVQETADRIIAMEEACKGVPTEILRGVYVGSLLMITSDHCDDIIAVTPEMNAALDAWERLMED